MKSLMVVVLSSWVMLVASCGGDATDGSDSGDGGSTSRFAVQKGFLITLNDSNTINVFTMNTSNGATTRVYTFHARNTTVETLQSYKDNLLLLGTSTGSIVISVADDGYLSDLATVSHARSCDPVIAVDDTMYVTLRNGGQWSCGGNILDNHLVVWDITNPSSPAQRAEIPIDQPYGLSALNDTLYVCFAGGLMTFDITTRWNPVKLSVDERWQCDDIIAREDALYLTQFDGGIQLLDHQLEPLSDLLPGE